MSENAATNAVAIQDRRKETRRDNRKKAWYKFSRSKASVVGLVLTFLIIIAAILAPYIVPYPDHLGAYADFSNRMQPPSAEHWCGTDNMGRDIFSRIIYSFRSALLMGIMVLAITVPVGFLLGVVAGYFKGTLIDSIIMRITDIFLSIPALIMALAVASIMEPNLRNSMLAITVLWWPWYCRLAYGIASTLRTENYIVYAELTGAKVPHILTKEILPNCLGPVLTKMALDICWVIMMGATLSFVGLGEQAPKPALGNMVSEGIKYLPEHWWITIFPALAIILIVFSLNLVGDGISDIFAEEGN